MQKIFISTSFSSGKLEMDGSVLPEYRAELEAILEQLRAAGFEVFNAIEQMEWTKSHNPPEQKTKELLAELESSDLVLALLSDIISAGVQIEVGYAVARQIPVVFALQVDTSLPYVNQGLVNLGLASTANYRDIADLVTQITRLASKLPQDAADDAVPSVLDLLKTQTAGMGGASGGSMVQVPRQSPIGGMSGSTALVERGIVAPPVHPPTPVTSLSHEIANFKPNQPQPYVAHTGEFAPPAPADSEAGPAGPAETSSPPALAEPPAPSSLAEPPAPAEPVSSLPPPEPASPATPPPQADPLPSATPLPPPPPTVVEGELPLKAMPASGDETDVLPSIAPLPPAFPPQPPAQPRSAAEWPAPPLWSTMPPASSQDMQPPHASPYPPLPEQPTQNSQPAQASQPGQTSQSGQVPEAQPGTEVPNLTGNYAPTEQATDGTRLVGEEGKKNLSGWSM